MIKAPYNFVPLNESVFLPGWADLISHDLPFKNGFSGHIDIEIKALSPIFIKDGQAVSYDTENNREIHEFAQLPKEDGRYFIPATTLKGAIRNVLEAMSFGKMNRVNNAHFSQRDFSMRQEYTLLNRKDYQPNIRMGWLKSYKGPHGEPITIIRTTPTKENELAKDHRIDQDDIDPDIYKGLNSYNYKNKELASGYNNNSGTAKYNKLFEKESNKSPINHPILKRGNRIIVMTGQTGPSNKKGNNYGCKSREFLFPDPWAFDGTPQENTQYTDHPIGEGQLATFLSAYDKAKMEELNKDGSTWEYWKPYFKKGEFIPVFFVLDSKEEVAHFGLSMLYKLPYTYSVHDLIKRLDGDLIQDHSPDLAECIFGYITSDKPELKGRVQFGHAVATNKIEPSDKYLHKVLGSPRASFYPYYIRQKLDAEGDLERGHTMRTYNNKDAQINGRKRYPVHKRYNENLGNAAKGQEKVATSFRPLAANKEEPAIFISRIHYHNLRPEELGALFSALTFHGNEMDCRHSIGMGKALGLGKCQLLVQEAIFIEDGNNYPINKEGFMGEFEAVMNTFLGKDRKWADSPPVVELLNMAWEEGQHKNLKLQHPKTNLTENKQNNRSNREKKDNEFVVIKAGKRDKRNDIFIPKSGLPRFSKMLDQRKNIIPDPTILKQLPFDLLKKLKTDLSL